MTTTKRKTTYQRMKEEIAALRSDIYHLVKEPNTERGLTVLLKYRVQYEVEEQLFQGEPTRNDHQPTT